MLVNLTKQMNMKIKLTKTQLDKMILESLDEKIKSGVEESFDESSPEEDLFAPTPQTKGTISIEKLLTPGRFYKGDDV
jgi:hypothetical protein